MLDFTDISEHQRLAVDICVKRIVSGEKLTRLAGYAGTGKTTLSGIIAERADIEPEFCAYTGKAASVLTRKGYPAQTVHSLIMRYLGKYRDKRGDVELDFELDRGKASFLHGKLIVIDETSMIGAWLGSRIMSIGVPVLAIGDPFQLPPVKDVAYFGGQPDAMLTKVERHGGVILDLATDIRQYGTRAILRPEYGSVNAGSIGQSAALSFDQIICGKNATRHNRNRKMREMLGLSDMGLVAPGERIVCLENNYQLGVFNGQQFRVSGESYYDGRHIVAHLECECEDIPQYPTCFNCGWINGTRTKLWPDGFEYTGSSAKPDISHSLGAMVATYGYVLTANKAQGSEWESVLVIREPDMGGNKSRWLYTAVTRAQKQLVVIRRSL
jgi:exodeoxyribonuclease V